jgi:transposase
MLEKGYSVTVIFKRLGISDESLCYCVSKAKVPASQFAEQSETCQLKVVAKA